MSTKIIGNQIDATTRAIMEALQVTEQINLPNLNQTQVTALGTPAYGTLVYNSTEDAAQMYKADAQQGVPGWASVGGGGPSVGENSIVRTNGPTISENLTIGPTANGGNEFTNGFSAGPITIANGYTVTIENNATWNIIGGDDMTIIEVSDIIAQNDIACHGILEYSETRENITGYQSSGNVTHDFNSNATIWVTKTGGGNWTLSLNNLPDADGLYRIRVITENAGGSGIPSSISINGSGESIQWVGGSTPGHGGDINIVDFQIIKKAAQGQTVTWSVLGEGVNYNP